MTAPVYFVDLQTSLKENRLERLGQLLDRVAFSNPLKKNHLVAIKIHFGEKGNTAYVRPIYLRPVTDKVKAWGGKPFVTDANTLYVGTRAESVSHLQTAIENGFSYETIGAPLIIADGLRGQSSVKVPVRLKHFKTAAVAADIALADGFISVAHFKGHELAGFGGTIKNVGMGCAAREGKLIQHSNISPKVTRKKCIGCGECVSHCAQGAIALEEKKSVINPETCVGCGECILTCPQGAIQVQWNESIPVFQEKMVEYTAGVLKGKEGRTLFLNFLTDISPACDCYGHADRPIVRDIGILASTDPVAIDQASADLVNREPGNRDSALTKNFEAGEDKFRGVYPQIDWERQLVYGEEIGLGTRQYDLIPVLPKA
ncbi:MAG: DUF362 domain-containing protein [Desulfobacterota bacterium]|nr:DUF362 domain-containing protein [Thermodesulfobacteriota bacterium]